MKISERADAHSLQQEHIKPHSPLSNSRTRSSSVRCFSVSSTSSSSHSRPKYHVDFPCLLCVCLGYCFSRCQSGPVIETTEHHGTHVRSNKCVHALQSLRKQCVLSTKHYSLMELWRYCIFLIAQYHSLTSLSFLTISQLQRQCRLHPHRVWR
jgi:hypothetical protein